MYSLYLCYLSMFIYFEEKWVGEVPATGKVWKPLLTVDWHRIYTFKYCNTITVFTYTCVTYCLCKYKICTNKRVSNHAIHMPSSTCTCLDQCYCTVICVSKCSLFLFGYVCYFGSDIATLVVVLLLW